MNMKLHNPTLRVIEVIETVAENQSGLSLSQISSKINCPKSTLMPILKTLCEKIISYFLKKHYFILWEKRFYLLVVCMNQLILV